MTRAPAGRRSRRSSVVEGALGEAGEQRRLARRRGRPPRASPVSTSSGRTAGYGVPQHQVEPGPVTGAAAPRARPPPRGSRTRAAPSWSSARTGTASVARNAATAAAAASGGAVTSISQWLASSRSASDPPGDSTTSSTSRPSGSASSSSGVHGGRVDDLGEADLEVLRLAGRAGRRRAGVGDARVRVEARGVRHRDPGPEHRPLEGPAEVAVAGEPEPAALGVADPQPLDRRGLLLGLFTHRPTAYGRDRRRPSSQATGRPC